MQNNLINGFNFNANTNKMDSDYKSVTEQAGIYARDGGYNIYVEGDTYLKGAVIDSTATKNKNILNTGTITFADIDNKETFDTKGYGVNIQKTITDGEMTDEQKAFEGITPSTGIGTKGEYSSTTKSAIADGTIIVRDTENQKQDINDLRRNTQNTLNQLDKIFDKDKIEEKQEMAGLFSELAFNAIHELSNDKKGNSTWTEDQKVLAHALVGYVSGELADSKNSFSTALTAGVNKFVTEEILKDEKTRLHYEEHPEELQWISAALGSAVGQMAGGDATSGASISASGTKNNRLNMTRDEYFLKKEQYIQEKLEALDVPDDKKEEVYATMRVEFGNEFDTQMTALSISNDNRLYNEKLITMDGYIDVGNTVGKLNVTSDGYVIGGYAPEYKREIYLHNTFIQTGEGHIDTQFGTGSYPIGYYGLTDDKLVIEAKQDFWKNIGISSIPYVGTVVGVWSGIDELRKGEVLNGSIDIGSSVVSNSKNILNNIVVNIIIQYIKYNVNNPNGIVEIPSKSVQKGGENK